MLWTIRSLIEKSSSRSSPWQLSAAIALGVLCGLIPKTVGLFYVLAALTLCLPVHAMAAMFVCVTVGVGAQLLEPACISIGEWALLHPDLQDFWLQIDSLPLVPWLGLYKASTIGALIVGLASLVPFFLVSLATIRQLNVDSAPSKSRLSFDSPYPSATQQPNSSQSLLNVPDTNEPDRDLEDRDLEDREVEDCDLEELDVDTDSRSIDAAPSIIAIAANSKEAQKLPDANATSPDLISVNLESPNNVQSPTWANDSTDRAVAELESLLGEIHGDENTLRGTEQIMARAARVASLVDDLLATLDSGEFEFADDSCDVSVAESCEETRSNAWESSDQTEGTASLGCKDNLESSSQDIPSSQRIRLFDNATLPTTASASSDSPVLHTDQPNTNNGATEFSVATSLQDSKPKSGPSNATGTAPEVRALDGIESGKDTGLGLLSKPQSDESPRSGETLEASDDDSNTANSTSLQVFAHRNVETRNAEALHHLLRHLRELRNKV